MGQYLMCGNMREVDLLLPWKTCRENCRSVGEAGRDGGMGQTCWLEHLLFPVFTRLPLCTPDFTWL